MPLLAHWNAFAFPVFFQGVDGDLLCFIVYIFIFACIVPVKVFET